MSEFFERVLIVAILIVCLFPVYMIGQSIMASGRIDFCYIDRFHEIKQTSYTIMGHRSWRSDIVVGTDFRTLDEAKAAADNINCPIGSGK